MFYRSAHNPYCCQGAGGPPTRGVLCDGCVRNGRVRGRGPGEDRRGRAGVRAGAHRHRLRHRAGGAGVDQRPGDARDRVRVRAQRGAGQQPHLRGWIHRPACEYTQALPTPIRFHSHEMSIDHFT